MITELIVKSSAFDIGDTSDAAVFSSVCCVKYSFEILTLWLPILRHTVPWSKTEQRMDKLLDVVFLSLSKRLCWLSEKCDANRLSMFTENDNLNFVTDICSKLKTLLAIAMDKIFGKEFNIKSDVELQVVLNIFHNVL